jgi:hypothetical protein
VLRSKRKAWTRHAHRSRKPSDENCCAFGSTIRRKKTSRRSVTFNAGRDAATCHAGAGTMRRLACSSACCRKSCERNRLSGAVHSVGKCCAKLCYAMLCYAMLCVGRTCACASRTRHSTNSLSETFSPFSRSATIRPSALRTCSNSSASASAGLPRRRSSSARVWQRATGLSRPGGYMQVGKARVTDRSSEKGQL